MKAHLFLFAFCLLSGSLTAQPIVKDAISVNGLQVGEHYSQERLVQALGQPTKVEFPSADDEYSNAYTYYYGRDRFYLIDGEFYGFDLRTSAFKVNGWMQVGDSISKIDALEGIKSVGDSDEVRLIDWRPANGELYDWLSVRFYYDENQKVTFGIAFINDL